MSARKEIELFLFFRRKRLRNFQQAVAQRNIVMLSTMIKADRWLLNSSDENGWTALHAACNNGDIETAKLMISLGAEITGLSHKGRCPIHLAVMQGHINTVELLVANGCPVDLPTKQGDTALVFAAQTGQPRMVQMLLMCGANPMRTLSDGRRVIDHAADEELKRMMRTNHAGGNKPYTSLT